MENGWKQGLYLDWRGSKESNLWYGDLYTKQRNSVRNAFCSRHEDKWWNQKSQSRRGNEEWKEESCLRVQKGKISHWRRSSDGSIAKKETITEIETKIDDAEEVIGTNEVELKIKIETTTNKNDSDETTNEEEEETTKTEGEKEKATKRKKTTERKASDDETIIKTIINNNEDEDK
jgi:hypothetical protein